MRHICVLSLFLMGMVTVLGQNHPNIVFIIADDMGYGDLSCLNPDSKLETVALDKLASQGIVFTNAHSAGSTCVPSRYGLMTGRMPWRKGTSLGLKNHVPLIEENSITLPRILKQAGYRTAAFGKWHLGWHWPWKESVEKRNHRNLLIENLDFNRKIGGGPMGIGFDYSFGVDEATFPNVFIEDGYTLGIPDSEVSLGEGRKPGIGVKGWDIYDMMPELTRRVVNYIEDNQSSDKPFFVYFAMTAPHTPLVPTDAFRGASGIGPYGDFVLQCDQSVGAVLDALDSTGLDKNTLVIFTSDNGSPAKNKGSKKGTILETGHSPSGIQRGFKGDALEGGHHIPFIARWPGFAPAGKINNDLICLVDMLATFAAMTGQDVPAQAGEDSINALPLLIGIDGDSNTRDYMVHRSQTLFHSRKGDWKLIFGSGSGGLEQHSGKSDPDAWQLYNLQNDPSELDNLYRQYPEIEENLEQLLIREKNK